jgi:hypothetical protein
MRLNADGDETENNAGCRPGGGVGCFFAQTARNDPSHLAGPPSPDYAS